MYSQRDITTRPSIHIILKEVKKKRKQRINVSGNAKKEQINKEKNKIFLYLIR